LIAERPLGARIAALKLPWPELAGLFVYSLVLWLLRPVTPFEWDEVLFQRALDHYDVASHHPHPPGFPVYVAIARGIRWIVGDPLLALQIVSMVCAIAALVLLWLLARRLGAPRPAATVAAAILAVVPGFAFNATVGISDGPGTMGAIAAALVFLVALDRPRFLPWAVFVSAVLTGIRAPSLLPALPLAVAAVVVAIRRRQWKSLLLAVPVGLATLTACWLPAVLITGAARYRAALVHHAQYIATVERGLRLPRATLYSELGSWGAKFLGTPGLATALWALVLVGSVAWFRRGNRRLFGFAAGGAGLYFVFVAFTLNYTVAMRYALPAAPFLALLAAGGLTLRPAVARRTVAAVILLWCLVVAAWAAPAYPWRRHPSPVWSSLVWVRQHFDPATTTVVYDGVVGPHVEYVLGRAGFRIVKMVEGEAYPASLRPRGAVLTVTPRPVPGGEVVYAAQWHSKRVLQLAWNRYGRCTVTRVPAGHEPSYSPNFQDAGKLWYLEGTGVVTLAAGAPPRILPITAGSLALCIGSAGFPSRVVTPGATLRVPLVGGPAGAVTITPQPGRSTSFEPVVSFPAEPGNASAWFSAELVVPQAAESRGSDESVWRTDLTLFNPQPVALSVAVAFLATMNDNSRAATARVSVPAGGVRVVPKVLGLPEFVRAAPLGAVLLYADSEKRSCGALPCRFFAFSRTYNVASSRGTTRIGEGLPAVPAAAGLAVGDRALFDGLVVAAEDRVNLGVAAWAASGVIVRETLFGVDGRVIERRDESLPPFGHLQRRLPGRFTGGRVEVEVVTEPPSARVYAYLSLVAGKRNTPTHMLPEIVRATSRPPPFSAAPPQPLTASGRPPRGDPRASTRGGPGGATVDGKIVQNRRTNDRQAERQGTGVLSRPGTETPQGAARGVPEEEGGAGALGAQGAALAPLPQVR
jgi:Dolichyl-phosphate-mannose-protein mannosyltransferase